METTEDVVQVAMEDVVQVVQELRRDFEGTCVAIAGELATCDDPSHWLELLTVLVLRYETCGLSVELAQRLDSDLSPQVVQLLLGKSFALNAVESVNRFFQWTLSIVNKLLEQGDWSRLSCLARILDAHRRFYLYHGTNNDGNALSHEGEVESRGFTVRESSGYTSRFFLRNLEFWGQLGGFSSILEMMQAGASFEALQCILRILYDVKDHLAPEFLLVYFPKLVDAVCTLVKMLEPSEFYTLPRNSLLEVVQVMELLLVKIQHDVDAAKETELCEQQVQLLRLEISLRFFQSSSLEKRIYGLTEIVVIITRLYNDQIQEQAEPTAVSLYATLSYLVDWMHKTQLMQTLLGEKMHVELVKRSTSLFQFASELEVLPTDWIDLVWESYHADSEEESRPVQRRHEAFRSTIHDLLLEMATFMEPPSLIHLVRRIEGVKARLDSNQLGLLAAIAARRLLVDVTLAANVELSQNSIRQRILTHLWAIVLPSAKSEEFRDEVLLRMHEMLRLEALGDETGEETEKTSGKECAMVEEFFRLSLDNISRREKLVISLKLFTQLSSLVAEVGIILSESRRHSSSYVQILLNETVEYKEGVRQALNASEWLKLDDEERAELSMLKDHVSAVKNRLLALRAAWILDECSNRKEASVTEEHLNKVWELMIVDAFLLDEAALCFQWIELCMNTPLQKRIEKEESSSPRALMPISIAEYLLTTKFSTLPGNCITLSTLCCFHSIFRRLNLLKGGLEIFSTTVESTSRASSVSSDGKEETVELITGQALVGIDELWKLAVTATDAAVAEEIITLLASFHLSFAPEVRQTDFPFQCKMRFLEKSMEFIRTAKVVKSVAIVNRCVDLLRYFLDACKVGDESAKEEEEMLQKLEKEGLTTEDKKKKFRLEHLEERLPYLEIYPSPMKETQSDASKVNYRTGRRPSWTFKQQHALLDVIVDSNEETEIGDTNQTNISPLKVNIREELLTGSPNKPNLRSPCVRADLRWPQAPSPQRGPDLRPEDIDFVLTGLSAELNAPTEKQKSKTNYGVMSQVLANQGSHFDDLLELVDWEDSTSQRTWDLLCRLPTNNELLRNMIRLRRVESDGKAGDVYWSELLDGSNIHRLLYALRLVEALLIPIETSSPSDRELNSGRRQWRERFVRLGGARHLYETLLKWPQEHSTSDSTDPISSQYTQNSQATCLAAVVRVLNYFFYWTRQEKAQSPFDLRLQNSTLPEFVKSIDLSLLFRVAVQLTTKISQNSENQLSFSDEVAEAVFCGVQMCCSLIHFTPDVATLVFKSESEVKETLTMSGWLKSLLVECPSKTTRSQVLGILSEMATDSGIVASAVFEPLVVSSCFLVSEDFSGSYKYSALEELFLFCRVLLGCCGTDKSDKLAVELLEKEIPGRLVRCLGRIVSQRRQTATNRSIRAPRNQEEGVLGGYLQLLALVAHVSDKIRLAILHYDVENSTMAGDSGKMIRFIHNDLLFGDKLRDMNIPLICRTSLTRDLAQKLLLNLVLPKFLDRGKESSGLNGDVLVVLDHLRGFQDRVLETVNISGRQWNFSPADSFLDASASTHHAGLVNPGCICYMNSLVQQLFMMPEFCGGLLALDCSKFEAVSSWKDEIEHLQNLFVSLAYTNYRSTDPTAFALSHKDMDGNSTDVHVQMDADEFFSLLLDRLEMFIRPKAAINPSEDDFMAHCFGGVLVNQILTQQGNLSEREEKFFALSLEVSKKRHLAESLELYVQGETLEGENAYFCERMQRKVSATKRVCIKKLPHNLVCHLKRFEFDYDTMEKLKINDFMEFPMEIDMFPYTSEALAATDNGNKEKMIMYDLVGVVVHSGTSDTGHYYSFIKDRHEAENLRWLEFNDEVVRDFDVDTIGEECFGGEEVAQKWDTLQATYSPVVQMKRRSAYMLIYEKREVENVKKVEIFPLSNPVKTLSAQILRENAQYEDVVNAFDSVYEQFIRDLVGNVAQLTEECKSEVSRKVSELGCQFLFGISSLRSRSPSSPTSQSPSHLEINARVALWLSEYGKFPSIDQDEERVKFSKWILAQIVASPTDSLPKSSKSRVEAQRTWLFDVLFLSYGGSELVESCFHVLLAAVAVLTREILTDNEAEASLVVFFRETLNLFFSRESRLDICDPVSGCILTLSLETRVTAMKQLGTFFDKCITGTEKMTMEVTAIRRLFLEKLQFLSHFLLTLQTPCEISDVASAISSRGIAPLAIETRSTTRLHEQDLRLCTFQLEVKLLKLLLEAYNQPILPPLDTTLLFSHSALKNVVLFGLEDVVLPLLTRIMYESDSLSSKCDRLVALLIGVLEEVKDSHADKVLAVFGRFLDEENERSKGIEEFQWTVHRHVFSPTRGILESVVYYRDHGSRDYTLLLLEFVVRRASTSRILQELFKRDVKFHSSTSWIPQWLVDHVDSNGFIRQRTQTKDRNPKQVEAQKLFHEVEQAFGEPIPVYSEDQGLLLSPPMSPAAIAAEDVLLEALEIENQKEKLSELRSPKPRQLGKISDENGPELEGNEGEWKLLRSREELSTLLRIDLDITHNNAREA
ncbi:Ubiquitin carboxyl-terminal hydrolase 34 [Phytophthora citrophthora]|uniref:ubiquitinyl hydrolase 1 n=1 Tax=Phytophthora citrophthora TaxID=4793 RepID=A0AAD9G4D5_9STRA|nr:Ubiquitin carboxyl-terminal hydrolase 34 [Phytophthora citrophthora]